jgi:hypothetical protein
VFVDGAAVPFSRREPEGEPVAAFFRGPRATLLAVRPPDTPAEVVVVRESPILAVGVQLARLLGSPREAAAVAALFVAVLVLATIALRGRSPSPRVTVAAALGTLVWWRALELYERPWGPVLLAAECALVMIVALRAASRRVAKPAHPWLGLRVQAHGSSPTQK